MATKKIYSGDSAASFSPEVKNVITMTLAFAKAVGAHQEDQSSNLVVSGYNALSCLSMVAKGASENTREEMARTLFGASARSLNTQVKKLVALNKDVLETNKDQVTLTTADAVWVNANRVPMSQTYADSLRNDMGATISSEDFQNPATENKMNKWASDNTNGLIDKIIEGLDNSHFAVLASALYFKGDFTKPFKKEGTADKAYTLDDGSAQLTKMMHKNIREGDVGYADGGDFQAISMTYGKEDYAAGKLPTMRLVLVRPSDDDISARDFLAEQADGKIPAWLDPRSFSDQVAGSIEVPHIDMKEKYDLIDPLKEMGIKDAFVEEEANFRPMTDGKADLYIGKADQQVVFKTDEIGSEAAAVTTVGMIFATSVRMPAPRINVKLDRSFVLAVQDIKTGAVLFAGAINKPNNAMTPKP